MASSAVGTGTQTLGCPEAPLSQLQTVPHFPLNFSAPATRLSSCFLQMNPPSGHNSAHSGHKSLLEMLLDSFHFAYFINCETHL